MGLIFHKTSFISIILFLTFSCSKNDVESDVLFVVLGKMSLYDQSSTGEITLRNHHFVAEIMPTQEGKIIGGILTSEQSPSFELLFNPEGRQFLAHGERVMEPEELHKIHPDGTYLFSYKTKNGQMDAQPVTIIKRPTTDTMPAPALITLSQNDIVISPEFVNPDLDLNISWTPMKGNMKSPNSELDDLIFVLGFDCFGNNIAHSGRPYQNTPYLTYKDTSFTIPSDNLEAGIIYSIIVEQATADVKSYKDVPGIATYATLTFLNTKTIGSALEGKSCPKI